MRVFAFSKQSQLLNKPPEHHFHTFFFPQALYFLNRKQITTSYEIMREDNDESSYFICWVSHSWDAELTPTKTGFTSRKNKKRKRKGCQGAVKNRESLHKMSGAGVHWVPSISPAHLCPSQPADELGHIIWTLDPVPGSLLNYRGDIAQIAKRQLSLFHKNILLPKKL